MCVRRTYMVDNEEYGAMGIVTKIAAKVGLASTETYSYECDNCGELFDSTVPSPSLVTCPNCDAERPTAITDTS